MEIVARFAGPGVVFVLTLASGLWLSFAGKPLNMAIFNIHKLVALAAVVLTAVRVWGALDQAHVEAAVMALLVLAGLCVVALFASGALMSIGKLPYSVLLGIHRVAPLLAVVAIGLMIYLLAGSS